MENKVREDNVNVNFRANKLSNDKFGRTAISLVKISLRLREQLHSRYGWEWIEFSHFFQLLQF